MSKLPINCSFCNKIFFRPSGRINEAVKFKWKQFCSDSCLGSSRNRSIVLFCERPGCGKKFLRPPKAISLHNYCSRSCSVIVNNSTNSRNPAVRKICLTCSQIFVSNKKYCSASCKSKGQVIGKERLIEKIQTFCRLNGRIPLKREFGHYGAVRYIFSTWNNAIKAAGFEPNPVMFAKKYTANDGHVCDSLAERIIDDWLSRRNIPHKRSFPYPGNKGFTVDFLIGKVWIEFFGLSGELKRYDQLKRSKIRLAKKFNLQLIKLYPKDLFPKGKLDEILGKLLT